MPTENPRICPTCKTPIPARFPAGMCPKCLLVNSALKVDDEETATAEKTIGPAHDKASPTTLESLRPLFPDLEILDVLGSGGMGAVYKARQSRLDRLVALKIMTCKPGHEEDFALRFEREAQVLARLSHSHIVVIHDFGERDEAQTGGAPIFYFLMEYVDGTDLAQLIRAGDMKAPQALAIVPQICDALQYAHDAGITHRDIKPANILIDKRGTVKIADFGLAKMTDGEVPSFATGLTQTGTTLGTPHYMAPEQWEDPDLVDHRADIYALGVVFYEMLTGERPAGVFEPPSKKNPMDKRLDGVVLRAMERNPDRRYQQASQIKSDVTRISTSRSSRRAEAASQETGTRKKGHLWLTISITGILALSALPFWPNKSSQPNLQASGKTAPAWIKVPFTDSAVSTKGAKLERQGSQLRLNHDAWIPAPDQRFKNAAQRVSFIWRKDTENIALLMGPESPANRPHIIDKHYAKLQTDNYGNRYCQIGKFTDTADTSLTGYARPVKPPINPGDRVEFQFATLNDIHYVWLNGQLIYSVHSQVPESKKGNQLVISAYEAILDSYEYLPLDGLGVEESLRLLGVDSVPKPTPTQSPKPATASSPPPAQIIHSKGRLTAQGTYRKGSPIDISKAAGITDFTQVVLLDYSWVALRAGGQTISSDGRGERTNIRKICPGGETCFTVIDTENQAELINSKRSTSNSNLSMPPEVNRIGVEDLGCDNHHAIALLKDGSVRVWGNHYDNPKAVPEWLGQDPWQRPPPEALTNVVSIAITPMSASTVTRDGRLWTWGKSTVSIPTNAITLQGQYASVISTTSGLYDALTKDGTRVSFNLSLRDAQIGNPGIVSSTFGGYRPLHYRPEGIWSTFWITPGLLPFIETVRRRPASSFSLMIFHEGDDQVSIGLITIDPES